MRLSDGLGNRLFQCAALLGYAERWGRRPVLFPSQILPSNHADATQAHELFPQLRLAWDVSGWATLVEEAANYASYRPFSRPGADTEPLLLQGYFQTERYFPTTPIVLSFETVLGAERMAALDVHYRDCDWWIHVRWGDYAGLSHYHVGIEEYIRAVMRRVSGLARRIWVYTDSPEVVLPFLCGLGGVEWIWAGNGLTPIETLYVMRHGKGGCICTNSTFGWWGAYGSAARATGSPIYFPGRWHRLPYAWDDVYPSWGIRVDY
jgi:hypothetical protein